MRDNEIIKALKCCYATSGMLRKCKECPMEFEGLFCFERLILEVLDLINRQQAEIEEKRETSFYLAQKVNEKDAEIEVLKKLHETAVAEREANVKGFTEELNAIKSKAIKEFAERVKAEKFKHKNFGELVCVEDIDHLVKEMTEGV